MTWAHTSDLAERHRMARARRPPDVQRSQYPRRRPRRRCPSSIELEAAGLSGLAIGDDMQAPPLEPGVPRAGRPARFPGARDSPRRALRRRVAGGGQRQLGRGAQATRRTVQLYEALRGAVSTGRVGAALLRRAGPAARLPARSCSTQPRRCRWSRRRPEPPPGLADASGRRAARARRRVPGVLRVSARWRHSPSRCTCPPGARPRSWRCTTDEQAPTSRSSSTLRTSPRSRSSGSPPNASTEPRLGSELLAAMLERRLEPASAPQQLARARDRPRERRAWCRSVRAASRRRRAQPAPRAGPARRASPHPLETRALPRSPCRTAPRRSARCGTAVGAEVALGVSDPLRRPDRAPDAAREAGWAETAAHKLGSAAGALRGEQRRCSCRARWVRRR